MEEGEARDIAIIHFNTPELTMACIRSINKHSPGCRITILDNSDKRPFPEMEGVNVIDNTRQQVIPFDEIIHSYPERIPVRLNNDGSARHILSVDYMFDVLRNGFVLMDSDVLVRKDISRFFDVSKAWIGELENSPKKYRAQRIEPYIVWVNVPMCRNYGIRFWHEGYADKVSHQGGPPWYDTGASFYKDCEDAGLPHEEINIYEYIEHFAGGSYKQSPELAKIWLELFRVLYE